MVGHVWVLTALPRVTTPKQNLNHLISYHEPLGIAVSRMLPYSNPRRARDFH